MKAKMIMIFLFLSLFFAGNGFAQDKRPPYQYPAEPAVLQTIKNWQDLKFGLFMHWGAYSQWGIVESWSLCPEDHDFTSVRPKGKSYFDYVKDYENLKTTFNPVKFNPEKWAKAAKYAGMKYVVFTTKHHDGFNMFDTKQSDYKITSKSCPFSKNPRANVAKEIFNAFRSEQFMAGAYFSIADWNNKDYWWDYFPPFDRRINYSPELYPEKWTRLNNFMCNQLEELVGGDYGKLDMLWFDLCSASKEKRVDWPRFTKMARSHQPGIMMVARGSNDQYENYRTPEQDVPEGALDYPWETCMTMGDQWSYKPNDKYKSTYQLVRLLVTIVSRGGNFLLNVGPGPDGELDPTVYDRLKGIGDWMQINGESIYGTKAVKPYHETKMVFTQKEKNIYAFYLPDEDEKAMPAKVTILSMQPVKGSQVFLLGYHKPLQWETNGKGIVINVPKALQNTPVCQNAWTFKLQVQ
ncbi:MAG: alpha-L-fucosidase [Bacteroidales bacterium]|nr:alpha-L-fucosidase [Bacteroidales bacterium]